MSRRLTVPGPLMTGTTVSPTDDISRSGLLDAMSRYDFTECDRVRRFLLAVCGQHLSRADYAWINAELKACLQNHDDGSNRACFQELRYLQMRAEYLLSLGYLLQGTGA